MPLSSVARDFRRPAGYLLLRQRHALNCLPHHVESFVARDFYRYVDCTLIAETLFSLFEETIEKELPAEILFLQQYDTARRLLRNVVDLLNRHADLFIRLCLQYNGSLSKAMRQLPEYALLSDKEIAGLETAVGEAFALQTKK